MRLQRALARAGVASRRASEDLIREGVVKVNGAVATIGTVVDVDRDEILVSNKKVTTAREESWLVLHKPIGYVTTRSDPEGRPTVFALVPEIPGLTYVGRLDVLTEGLLLLTTDGAAVNRLTHPRYEIEKGYRVDVTGQKVPAILERLGEGVMVEDRRVAVSRYQARKADRGVEITLTITEGRNRIVRRLCEEIGVSVDRLVRINHGGISLDRLRAGQWRHLTPSEIGRMQRTISK